MRNGGERICLRGFDRFPNFNESDLAVIAARERYGGKLMKKIPRDYDGSRYGIELESTAVQNMAQATADHSVLQETVYFWLRGTTAFFSVTDMAHLTYGDFVGHIGCDAQEYRYDSRGGNRVYTWAATDKPVAKFSAFFRKNDNGEWTVYATGSSQISVPDEYIDRFKR